MIVHKISRAATVFACASRNASVASERGQILASVFAQQKILIFYHLYKYHIVTDA